MIVPVPALRPTDAPRGAQIGLGLLREGQAIDALVESIGNDGIVRLSVAGMALLVSSPIRLQEGSMVRLLVRQGGTSGMTLELRRSDPPPAQGSISPAGALKHGQLGALLDVSAALSTPSHTSSGEPVAPSASPANTDRGGSQLFSSRTRAAPTETGNMPTDSDADPASIRNAAVLYVTPDMEESHGTPPLRPDASMQIRAAAEPMIAPPSLVVTYATPETAVHRRIAEKRDNEGNDVRPPGDAAKVLKASFTVRSEALGRVHVVVHQHESTISVGMWAERPEVATELLRDRAELCDVLSDADIAVEALDVFVGDPPVVATKA